MFLLTKHVFSSDTISYSSNVSWIQLNTVSCDRTTLSGFQVYWVCLCIDGSVVDAKSHRSILLANQDNGWRIRARSRSNTLTLQTRFQILSHLSPMVRRNPAVCHFHGIVVCSAFHSKGQQIGGLIVCLLKTCLSVLSISIIRSSFGNSLSWKAARGRHAPLRNLQWRQLSTWRRQYKVWILIFDL